MKLEYKEIRTFEPWDAVVCRLQSGTIRLWIRDKNGYWRSTSNHVPYIEDRDMAGVLDQKDSNYFYLCNMENRYWHYKGEQQGWKDPSNPLYTGKKSRLDSLQKQ